MKPLPTTYREIHRRALDRTYRYSSAKPDPTDILPPIFPREASK